jgi:rifampicin phosphotransferase
LQKAEISEPNLWQNKLLSGEPGIESTQPTKLLLKIAGQIRKNPEIRTLFNSLPADKILIALKRDYKSIYENCLQYIELYGDRTMGELKLETKTLKQDSSFMFKILKNYIEAEHLDIAMLEESEQKMRYEAERHCFEKIRKAKGVLTLYQFKKDLKKFRSGVRNRENMRLARTRMFGLYRSVYHEIGNQLEMNKIISSSEDIFYLTRQEILDFCEGRAVSNHIKEIIKVRKQEYSYYERQDTLNHFAISKPTGMHMDKLKVNKPEVQPFGDKLKGIGCYPGVVESTVQVLKSHNEEVTINGKILCAVRTDPGWAPLFPTCKGILVERGSTLSHSAVVARELGIPAIVGIKDLCHILKSGDMVRMDGGSGEIQVLDEKFVNQT